MRAVASSVRPSSATSDRGVAAVIAVGYVVLLLATMQGLGYARDEGFYFHAAKSYQAWLELVLSSPGRALAEVDRHFVVNHEHPSLIKLAMAVSHGLGWQRLHLFAEEGTSFRFVGVLGSSLALAVTYLWGARQHSRLAGLMAALLLGAMPRFFYHAHLACFDGPIVGLWLLAAYAYHRALQKRDARATLLAGLCFGLALDTKHNSWFLPIVCLAHLALVTTAARWSSRERAEEGGRVARAHLRRAVPVLAAMAILGPVVTWLLWPWLWHDTAARVAGYARFHLGHVYYNMELFGRNYFEPPMPRAYAFVMTAATVPTVTLVAAVLGAGASLRRGWRSRRRLGEPFAGAISAPLFWLLAIALVYGAWLLPTTPIFGGTKHWMTTYPFVALFAGVGVAEGVRRALAGTRRRWAPAVMGASALAVVAAPAVETLGAHPWALSAYVPLFGGAAGGATLGLNRGFWGYTTGAPRVLAELSHAPPGARIYLHDTATSAWDMLVADGHLRPDLRRTQDLAQADVLLYHQELHMQGVLFQIWGRAGTTAPQLVDGLDGVPVVLVFDASETP